jgi:hypothetical protein
MLSSKIPVLLNVLLRPTLILTLSPGLKYPKKAVKLLSSFCSMHSKIGSIVPSSTGDSTFGSCPTGVIIGAVGITKL